MPVAADGLAQRRVLNYPVRKKAPKASHQSEDHGEDTDVEPGGVMQSVLITAD